jgi:hypothetical protein
MCDEIEVNRHTTLDICDNCYEFVRYWKKKSVKQIVQRNNNLDRAKRRMQYLGLERGLNQ